MAASVFCCLRWCRDGGAGHIPLKEMPAVQLDTQRMGTDVVIVKNGRRICGTGGCLANAPLHQNKSYFEFKIQSTELNVYLNGKNMHCPASGIRGTVYPVVYVDDSAILDCQFSEFYHTPPPGFEKILFEQQIF
uniref:SPRY domain-containing protein 7 n=1 Tax=Pavo cristatus TaxID=9049 RepID=A0A8C9FXP9_PAVCR